uniref:small ubiquitin-related modifier 2-like n=1 Tax=Erigeron canadensis TaxID=72917 RepID=UPI001CB96AEA|nr:small ubiquitin-related modifier 2-like [Erigeron canadensis]
MAGSIVPKSTDRIVVIVKDQRKHKLFYKVKKDIPIRKVMVAFCKKTQTDFAVVNFILNGYRIHPHQTPTELKMKNLDEIDVMGMMPGGGVICQSHLQSVLSNTLNAFRP